MKIAILILTTLLFPNVSFAQVQQDTTTTSLAPQVEIDPDVETEIEMMKSIFKLAFDKINMEAEQKQQIMDTIEKNIPELAKAKSRFNSVLTLEEKKKFQGQFRFARVAEFTVERAQNYALGKIELSDERRRQYLKYKNEADFQDIKLKNEIVTLLTKEQLQKLPMFARDRVKDYAMAIILPHMKTDEHVNQVTERLSKIKGVKVLNVNLEKQKVKMHISSDKNTQKAMKQLMQGDNVFELFKDFEFSFETGDGLKELLYPKKKKTDNKTESQETAEPPTADKDS